MVYCRVAGLVVGIESFGRTMDQARPYIVDSYDKADIIIDSDIKEIHMKYTDLSDDGCEYLASGKDFYTKLIDFNGLMLHSSAIVKDGKAYLFSAPSGTGKSTHVCLWRRVFGDEHVRVLNDDKPALRLEDGTWYAYGTPWSGKTGQNLNLRVPLAGITMIERGEQNEIECLSARQAVRAILSQTTTLKTMEARVKQLELLEKLITQIPIWKLKCNMDPEAAIVSYEAMSGEKWRK